KGCLHRPGDLLGRYGGEEFVVLLPETDSRGALRVAESINKAIAALGLRHAFSSTANVVTVSISGSTCVHTSHHNLEELIKSADRALYNVKNSGRNRALVDEIASHKTVLIVDQEADSLQKTSELLQL